MLRHAELPLPAEIPAFEDDCFLFDPWPKDYVPGLGPTIRGEVTDADGLGLRSLLEKPEALSKAWRAAYGEPRRRRLRAAKVRHPGSPHRWSHAA